MKSFAEAELLIGNESDFDQPLMRIGSFPVRGRACGCDSYGQTTASSVFDG